jgi:hypothetical protein
MTTITGGITIASITISKMTTIVTPTSNVDTTGQLVSPLNLLQSAKF